MREYCTGCGDSFKYEDLDTCQCSRSLCWRCMAEHKQATGHSNESDKGRFRVQLNDVFTRNFLKELDKKIVDNSMVKSCFSLALPQAVHSQIWLKNGSTGNQLVRYQLERPNYESLFKELNNDEAAMLAFYTKKVTQLLE
jgi:hypothetical protein